MSQKPDPVDEAKRDAAEQAMRYVADGMIVGLGTGSTAHHVVEALATRVQRGLRVRALASSEATATQARSHAIPLVGLDEVASLDLFIDGADEVDPQGGLIKGRGGAHFREKVLASRAKTFVVVIDPSKKVPVLGSKFPVPAEVVPFAGPAVARDLAALGLAPVLRQGADGAPYLTDQGNWIWDLHTGPLADPRGLAETLDRLVGLVEHGLFLDMNPVVVVGALPAR